ncbi:MAG TPA: hypothetical protein VFX24_16790 [Ktedonobacterales bacterium]|nr:hypothetical protein [Ktedonobacterales bacterium]
MFTVEVRPKHISENVTALAIFGTRQIGRKRKCLAALDLDWMSLIFDVR